MTLLSSQLKTMEGRPAEHGRSSARTNQHLEMKRIKTIKGQAVIDCGAFPLGARTVKGKAGQAVFEIGRVASQGDGATP